MRLQLIRVDRSQNVVDLARRLLIARQRRLDEFLRVLGVRFALALLTFDALDAAALLDARLVAERVVLVSDRADLPADLGEVAVGLGDDVTDFTDALETMGISICSRFLPCGTLAAASTTQLRTASRLRRPASTTRADWST
jgi:hypothetical protein